MLGNVCVQYSFLRSLFSRLMVLKCEEAIKWHINIRRTCTVLQVIVLIAEIRRRRKES